MKELIHNQGRDNAIDLLKFVAIFLVILGHSLSRLGLGMESLNHPIGKLIVMVNMPLFIFITGYFGKSLYKRKLKELFLSKYRTLLRPTVLYGLLTIIICDIIILSKPLGIKEGVNVLFDRVVYGYWFIWVVLYCSFYSWAFVKMGEKFHLKQSIALICSLLLLFLIPDTPFIPCLASFKAMYPFFLLGLMFRERGWLEIVYVHKRIVLPIALLIILVGWCFYKGTWSFYYFPSTPFPNVVYYYMLMLVFGSAGIGCLYIICKEVWKRYCSNSFVLRLAELGQYTLAIYMIQGVFVEVADCYQEQLAISNQLLLTLISIIASIVLIVIISFFILWIRRNKKLSLYCLGK